MIATTRHPWLLFSPLSGGAARAAADFAPDATCSGERSVRQTRWLFIALCGYFLSQSFTIPVLSVGPSWTLWPGLPDFALALLLLAWLLAPRPLTVPDAQHGLVRGAVATFLLASGSFILFTLLVPRLDPDRDDPQRQGPFWGAYALIRLFQVVLVAVTAAPIVWTPWRLAALRRVLGVVLFLVIVGVVVTSVGIVPTAVLGAHLPANPFSAGAWFLYLKNWENDGLGAIGYNHGYVACQLMLLLALYLNIDGTPSRLRNTVWVLLVLAAVFLTRSRSGFANMLLFALVWLAPVLVRHLATLLLMLALGVAGGVGVLLFNVASLENDPLFERQLSAFGFYDTQNLSGRDSFWQARLDYLNADPYRWVFGCGTGAAADFGSDSGLHTHLLPLHIICELGVVGLAAVAYLFFRVLKLLWDWDTAGRPLFKMTVTLLIFSLSYETFYPIPSMGYFLTFFAAALAIGLRPPEGPATPSPDPSGSRSRDTGGTA